MKSARVLVVDDEPMITEVILRALAQDGHLGTSADTAETADAALAAGAFDLILLDHVLPGTTGMQALGRLSRRTKAPIYIMSGYTGDDTRKDVLLLGAAGFLPKPIEIAEIMGLIDSLPERA